MNDMNFEGGEIIRMSWNGNSFGAPEVLVPATNDKNIFILRFHPMANGLRSIVRFEPESYAPMVRNLNHRHRTPIRPRNCG